MEFITKYKYVLLCVVLICASFFSGLFFERNKILSGLVSKVDTVTIKVPVYKDFPDPVSTAMVGKLAVPKYIFFSDTTEIEVPVAVPGETDTQYVYLPKEQKYYEEDEGRLRLWVSGYQPMLDRFELDRIEKIITNTVIQTPPNWAFDLNAGFSTDVLMNNVMLYPFVGGRITYMSKFQFGADAGYSALFSNNSVTYNPIFKFTFRYSFLQF